MNLLSYVYVCASFCCAFQNAAIDAEGMVVRELLCQVPSKEQEGTQDGLSPRQNLTGAQGPLFGAGKGLHSLHTTEH